MTVQLYLGDCLEFLRQMPDNSIDALVTDPPAGIGFMGKEWDTFKAQRMTDKAREDQAQTWRRGLFADSAQYNNRDTAARDRFVAFMVEVMSECLRVLKPGAHALVWALPRTSHWTGWALEEAGFEVRDRIAHLFGSGFPKSLDVSKAIDKMAGVQREIGPHREYSTGRHYAEEPSQGKSNGFRGNLNVNRYLSIPSTPAAVQWQGWGTALKPACEDWWLCRKSLAEGTVAANVLKWGTGAINVDATRIPTNGETGERCHNGAVYNGVAEGYQRPGASMYQHKTDWQMQQQGRFPANVTHDGSDEVLAGFPMTKPLGGPANGGSKSAWPGGKYQGTVYPGDSGSAARFFYCAKASRQDREEGCEGLEERLKVYNGQSDHSSSDMKPVEERWTTPAHNHHPTVKPTLLMRWLCRLITPPGGTVLDPFMGSGSTGKACALEGFNFIGMELDPEYYEIAKRRIEHVQNQPQMVMEI